jgi:pimeloyl-ACP methyl ester carboxylesterase
MNTNELLDLEDGRKLEVIHNSGDLTDAVVFHHGTPSDANLWNSWLTFLESKGIGAISFSRAGYGNSDRHLGRKVVSVNEDVQELIERFGAERFVAVGWSGGGPHAIANTLLTECKGALTLAGVGAYGVSDLNFLEGMGEENEIEFSAAVAGKAELTNWMEVNAVDFAKVTAEDLKQALGGLISQPDKDLLFDSYANEMAATFQSALEHGYWGWFDDDMAFVESWGFELSEIEKPVELWQGDQDLMVPHAHGIWLEKHLPNAKLVFRPGEGHMSLGENSKDEISRAIVAMLERS